MLPLDFTNKPSRSGWCGTCFVDLRSDDLPLCLLLLFRREDDSGDRGRCGVCWRNGAPKDQRDLDCGASAVDVDALATAGVVNPVMDIGNSGVCKLRIHEEEEEEFADEDFCGLSFWCIVSDLLSNPPDLLLPTPLLPLLLLLVLLARRPG